VKSGFVQQGFVRDNPVVSFHEAPHIFDSVINDAPTAFPGEPAAIKRSAVKLSRMPGRTQPIEFTFLQNQRADPPAVRSALASRYASYGGATESRVSPIVPMITL